MLEEIRKEFGPETCDEILCKKYRVIFVLLFIEIENKFHLYFSSKAARFLFVIPIQQYCLIVEFFDNKYIACVSVRSPW